MADITVPVPSDRVAEFYQFFGLWLAGSLDLLASRSSSFVTPSDLPQKDLVKPWGGDPHSELDDAAFLWAKFSTRARALFGLLMDNPGKKFTGEEIADTLGIPNGAHGVAGVFAWPGRHGLAIGRSLPSSWHQDDPETNETSYSMSAERASLFRDARERVEGPA